MNKIIFENYKGHVKDLFKEKEKYTFLVGAGISMNAPSNLPSAREFGRILLSYFGPLEDADYLLSIDRLRYEMIVERIQEFFDKDLIFLDYFDLVTEPNLIHLLLAHNITKENYVITTNFDCLIEYALKSIIDKDEHSKILPIITKKDFLEQKKSHILVNKGKYPIYKIHGSKRNIITNDDTTQSLVTTITALGKERERDVTFAIEPFKKQIVDKIMENRTLVVMGYSGSDEFDIGPVLRELSNLKQLIWIEHLEKDRIEILKTKEFEDPYSIENLSRSEKLLLEIRSDADFEVYCINTNTYNFVKKFIWPLLLPKIKIPKLKEAIKGTERISFEAWLSPKFKDLSSLNKYSFVLEILHDLGELKAVLKTAERALKVAEETNDPLLKSCALIKLGLGNRYEGNYDKSIEYYRKAYEISKESNNLHDMYYSANNLGVVYSCMENEELALKQFEKALELAKKAGDDWIQCVYLNNIGSSYMNLNQNDKAEEYYEKAIKKGEETGNLSKKALAILNKSWLYKEKGNIDKAIELMLDSIRIAKELGDLRPEAGGYGGLGAIYLEREEFGTALKYYKKSAKINEILNDLPGLANNFFSIGRLYYKDGSYEKALEAYNKSLEIYKKTKGKIAIGIILHDIGIIYEAREEYEKAIEQYEKAIEILSKIEGQESNLFTIERNLDNVKNKLRQPKNTNV